MKTKSKGEPVKEGYQVEKVLHCWKEEAWEVAHRWFPVPEGDSIFVRRERKALEDY